MSGQIRHAAAKLLRGAIEKIDEDQIRDALDAEQIRTSSPNINQLGRMLDEIDCDGAAYEADQRLIALEKEEDD